MKKENLIWVCTFVLALLVVRVESAGIASPAWTDPDPANNNPWKVLPGEEGEITLTLQNMGVAEGEDLTFRASVLEDRSGIIANRENLERTYDVPANTQNTRVDINYKIPDDAVVGTEYSIKLSFDPVISGGGGGVALGIGIETRVPFKVVDSNPSTPPAQSPEAVPVISTATYLAIISAIVLLVLVVVLISMRKKRNS